MLPIKVQRLERIERIHELEEMYNVVQNELVELFKITACYFPLAVRV